jgi:hypothetical protein
MNIIEKIAWIINEEETERMIHWVKTFSERHDVDPTKKGWHKVCVDHMKENMGEEGAAAYCARALDTYKGSTYWRGKDKSEKEASKDVEEHPNYPTSKRKKAKREKALKD